ncbi:three-Cys-motif partner protein TcmP [Acetobacter cerevisiae]|uniref:Three-Cys-motif partner protein TcmP n=1 Tax=Acetobacter cerevisiae TaxID=178900 RepID=A0A149V855_9PROT|nr:three-Cys-motif partner protein TcmP [Acetobacter cerevisiae]KXV76398.1 hypothetical protein AD954_12095 [Acetobacter cerevisiae]
MVAKKDKYLWSNGAPIDEHTKTKHSILKQYVSHYFDVRFQNPQVREFKFAIVDGFCGGGRYETGEIGSPLIFLQEIKAAFLREKIRRKVNGMPELRLIGSVFFNDGSNDAIGFLREQISGMKCDTDQSSLAMQIEYSCEKFEDFYPSVRSRLLQAGIKNVLFNLDQCGNTKVKISEIKDIIQTFARSEILLTFLIEPFLAYLPKHDSGGLAQRFRHLDITPQQLGKLEWFQDGRHLSYNERIGAAEYIVYNIFQECAQYISPFAIYNPKGWKYWSVHFSNNFRAREVYNGVLHDNATHQAHFGRSGLTMLCSDAKQKGALYLFDQSAREEAKAALYADIPRDIDLHNHVSSVRNFLQRAYRTSVAHRDDILATASMHPDISIITSKGNYRRSLNGITLDDTLVLAPQRSFFFMPKT